MLAISIYGQVDGFALGLYPHFNYSFQQAAVYINCKRFLKHKFVTLTGTFVQYTAMGGCRHDRQPFAHLTGQNSMVNDEIGGARDFVFITVYYQSLMV
ncbi:hypothetical protein [Paenibacillus alba]|uniref:hypothetical protein n=1 Tax=Paenibacillus alba TaxID=1197127 RepID=UPI001565CF7F|nr:hypothetical protein [Paenibacillus alba]